MVKIEVGKRYRFRVENIEALGLQTVGFMVPGSSDFVELLKSSWLLIFSRQYVISRGGSVEVIGRVAKINKITLGYEILIEPGFQII
jgi:hypothetical protein